MDDEDIPQHTTPATRAQDWPHSISFVVALSSGGIETHRGPMNGAKSFLKETRPVVGP